MDFDPLASSSTLQNTLQVDVSFSTISWLIFLFVIGFYVIATAILYFHWDTYATDKVITRTTVFFYLISTLPLILVMLLALSFI